MARKQSMKSLSRHAGLAVTLGLLLCPGYVSASGLAADSLPPKSVSVQRARVYTLAIRLYSKNQYDDEIVLLNGHLAKNPDDGYAAFLRALARYDLDEDDLGETDFSRVITLAPRFGPAYRLRCVTRLQRDDYDRAKSDCDMALRINRSDSRAHTYRGDVLLQLGRPAQALKDFNASIRIGINPGFMFARKCQAETDLRDYRAAQSDCERGIEQDPRQWFPLAARAHLEEREDRFADAARDATEAIELGSGPDLLLDRATAYIQLGKYLEAGRDANAYLEHSPDEPYALTARAVARAVLGDRYGAQVDVLEARTHFAASGDKLELAWINCFCGSCVTRPTWRRQCAIRRLQLRA